MKYSVVIPTYNKADLISQALDSVLAQNVKDVEIVVVDDGSVDDLDSVMKGYPEVTLIRQKNGGVSVARNTGINAASGQFICFLDADDKWLPGHLEELERLTEKYPNESYFITSHITTTPDGNAYGSAKALAGMEADFVCENLFKLLNDRSDDVLHTNSICVKKSVITDNKVYFEPGERIGEDTDMWLRLSLYAPAVITNRETTTYRREYSTATKNTSNTFRWILARRETSILAMDLRQDIKDEYLRLLDRYKMTCSRDYLLARNRAEAKKVLQGVRNKSKKYYISRLFCLMPYGVFRFLYKHIF